MSRDEDSHLSHAGGLSELVAGFSDAPAAEPTVALTPVEQAPLSTGVDELDEMLGIRGIQRGTIAEVVCWDPDDGTALLLGLIAAAQRRREPCGLIWSHPEFDACNAKQIGVDLGRLLCAPTTDGKTALAIAGDMLKSGLAVVVIDSLVALAHGDEGTLDLGQMASDPETSKAVAERRNRMLSKGLRPLVKIAAATGGVCICANRSHQAVEPNGNVREGRPGQRALDAWASQQISISAGVSMAAHKLVRIAVTKNEFADLSQPADFTTEYGIGVRAAAR